MRGGGTNDPSLCVAPSTRDLAEQVAGDVDYRKTSPFFRVRFKICLHKNLEGLLTGMNFDAYASSNSTSYRRPFFRRIIACAISMLLPALFLELLHSVLLIIQNARCKRHRARHAHMCEGDDKRSACFFRARQMADEAALVARSIVDALITSSFARISGARPLWPFRSIDSSGAAAARSACCR